MPERRNVDRKFTDDSDTREDLRPEVRYIDDLSMQVCVPIDWNDNQVFEFAKSKNPGNWHVRVPIAGLDGEPPRAICGKRTEFIHITLDRDT